MTEHTSEEKELTFGDAVRATAITVFGAVFGAVALFNIGCILNSQNQPMAPSNSEHQPLKSSLHSIQNRTNSVMEPNSKNPILVTAFSTTYQK